MINNKNKFKLYKEVTMFKSLVLEAFANKDVERANEIIVKQISKQYMLKEQH